MMKRVDSPDDIHEMLWGFAEHRILTVSARLGILGYLSSGGSTVEKMAAKLNLDALATGKIVRALHAMGLLDCKDDHYSLLGAITPFFTGGEDDITAIIEHSHILYDSWGESLEGWVRGEEKELKEWSREEIETFGEAMRAMGTHSAKQLVNTIDIRNVKSMLDVGGGFGHYSRAFVRKNPDLRAVIIDKPDVAEFAREKAKKDPDSGRMEWMEGDYLEADWGSGYDIVLLANVLHQELEKDAFSMVEKGALGLNPGGRLLVMDFSIDDEKSNNLTGVLFAVNMRSFGDTYSETDIREWMERAGLINVQRTDLSFSRWLITGQKAGS